MRITDGIKTVDIRIKRWKGNGFGPDWSLDFFQAGNLPYDEETDTYTVEDVDYCIGMALTEARLTANENGENVIDKDVYVMFDEV